MLAKVAQPDHLIAELKSQRPGADVQIGQPALVIRQQREPFHPGAAGVGKKKNFAGPPLARIRPYRTELSRLT